MQKVIELKQHFPHSGCVQWIGLRSSKGSAVDEKPYVKVVTNCGIDGDKAGARPGGKRQVTLFQAEYLKVINELMPQSQLGFAQLRRNIAISGINLNALKDCTLRVGQATLEVTGFCHPCSKLEKQLGYGIYNALRGHGGLTAKVIEGGEISLGDEVSVLSVHT